MLDVLGQTVPLALVVALSPAPLIALLLLMVAGSRVPAVARAVGWVIGSLLGLCLGTLLGHTPLGAGLTSRAGASGPQWKFLIVGAVFLVLALVNLRQARARAEPAHEPVWFTRLGHARALPAFVLGAIVALVMPQNFLMYLVMGGTIGSASLPAVREAVVIAVTGVICASIALILTVVALVRGASADRVLNPVRAMLVDHGSLILGSACLLVGMVQLVQFFATLT